MPQSPTPLPESLETLFSDTPETFTLENGLLVVHQQNLAHPVVSAQVWIKTGSIHEDQHLGSGLSHFLEHMLFKGTERRKGGEIAREVQAFGGQINAYTAFDRTVYYIDGPAEALDKSLDLLADFVFHSTLPADEVLKERDVILREIDMTLDDPDRILSRSLFSTAYQQHPFLADNMQFGLAYRWGEDGKKSPASGRKGWTNTCRRVRRFSQMPWGEIGSDFEDRFMDGFTHHAFSGSTRLLWRTAYRGMIRNRATRA